MQSLGNDGDSGAVIVGCLAAELCIKLCFNCAARPGLSNSRLICRPRQGVERLRGGQGRTCLGALRIPQGLFHRPKRLAKDVLGQRFRQVLPELVLKPGKEATSRPETARR